MLKKMSLKSVLVFIVFIVTALSAYADEDVKWMPDHLPFLTVCSHSELPPTNCNNDDSIYNSLVACNPVSSCDLTNGTFTYNDTYDGMPVYTTTFTVNRPLQFIAFEYDTGLIIYGDGIKELSPGRYTLGLILPYEQSEVKVYGFPWTNALTLREDEVTQCTDTPDPDFIVVDSMWRGTLKYCYFSQCQQETLVIEFVNENQWVCVTTMSFFGTQYLYEMMGTYSISGNTIKGQGNSRREGSEGWDDTENVTFELGLNNNGELSGSWDDGSGADIEVVKLVRQ